LGADDRTGPGLVQGKKSTVMTSGADASVDGRIAARWVAAVQRRAGLVLLAAALLALLAAVAVVRGLSVDTNTENML
jgi:hypothetical protein